MGENENSWGGKAMGGGYIFIANMGGGDFMEDSPSSPHVSAKMKTLHLLQAKSLPKLNKEKRTKIFPKYFTKIYILYIYIYLMW